METGIEHYARIADNYMTDDPYRLKYHQNRFKTFNALIPETPSLILDFGCGSAENVVHLSRLGHTVTAIDPVAELIEIGRRNLQAAGFPDTLHVGNVYDLTQFDDASFDVMAALSVLSYLDRQETEEFYRQTGRLLKSGGKAVLSFSNELQKDFTKKASPIRCHCRGPLNLRRNGYALLRVIITDQHAWHAGSPLR